MRALVKVALGISLMGNIVYGADSLNVRFVGNWPFGPSNAVAVDTARSIAFCGSGGGVYILDVSLCQQTPLKYRKPIQEALSRVYFTMSLLIDFILQQMKQGLKYGI